MNKDTVKTAKKTNRFFSLIKIIKKREPASSLTVNPPVLLALTDWASSGAPAPSSTLPPKIAEEVSKSTHLRAHQISALHTNWQYSHSSKRDKIEFAARFGLTEMISRMLDKHPGLVKESDVLYEACQADHYHIVVDLVTKYGADVNQKNKRGDYPIFATLLPLHENSLKILNFLIEHGAKVDVQGNFCKQTPIQYCHTFLYNWGRIKVEYIPLLKCLISAGANPHETNSLLGFSVNSMVDKLHAQPEVRQELQNLIKNEQSMEALSTLMAKHDLGTDMDSLLCALDQFSLNDHRATP